MLPQLRPSVGTQECPVFPSGFRRCQATLGDSDGPMVGDLRPLAGQRLVTEGRSRRPTSSATFSSSGNATPRLRARVANARAPTKGGDTCAVQLTGSPVRKAFHHIDGIQLIGSPIRWDAARLGDD